MIPYNPSSFNSNKTILEQILEIKKWLIAHPSYKVYYCISNFMPTGDDDRAFTEIAGTEEEVQNIAVGDLLVFPDAYYSEVIAVDLDNEMVTVALPATNFSGPQGATGPSGADGTNGTCIRYCNTNKNSNPSTTYAVSDITFSTGLQVNDCILFKNNRIGFVDYISGGTFRVTQNIIIDGKDGQYVSNATIDENGDLIITLYDPESLIQSNINVGHVVGADGVSITNVAIDGNQHLIVTLSDGNTIDAGSVSSGGMEVVELTSNTGTLSVDDFNKVNSYNCVIVRNNNIYVRERSSVYNTIKYCCSFADGSILKQTLAYTINLSTRVYTHATNIDTITEDSITSNIATNGQVLTADGNGNCSWQNAGSGVDIVTINASSGTLSASDLAKIQQEGCLLRRDYTSYYQYFELYFKSSTSMVFIGTSPNINTDVTFNTIEITLSTGAWTTSSNMTIKRKPTASLIDSGTATNGQVLTANGNGGASWQNAGGGSSKYQHNIVLFNSPLTFLVNFSIINTDASPYTTASSAITALRNYLQSNEYILGGGYDTTYKNVACVFNGGTDPVALCYDGTSSNSRNITTSTVSAVIDCVHTL